MPKYEELSIETETRIRTDRAMRIVNPYACKNEDAIRRDGSHDRETVVRPAFIRDADKILHCPFYSRYADKTQVFSFCKNDDISRRSLHVQLVSRIARTLGRALNLNEDLIEAISLGHDIGHTPFGHAGETYLDEVLFDACGLHFSHNIQSIRVLDVIYPLNITLQSLSGIGGHNGELEQTEYHPSHLADFSELDETVRSCLRDKCEVSHFAPSTLEGCVVRISDIIAYLGKDRQDAERMLKRSSEQFQNGALGRINAEIINNLMINIIENSYGKPYIKMDAAHFAALEQAKSENYIYIYKDKSLRETYDATIRPMMRDVFRKLLNDLKDCRKDSPIYKYHIDYVNRSFYQRKKPYENENPCLIVADFIAAMTDDFFLDLYAYLFPDRKIAVNYKGYFD